jgi:vacuolar iron transporter family protein
MFWGSISLLVYLTAFFLDLKHDDLGPDFLFLCTCVVTGISLFCLGAIKSFFTTETWWQAGSYVLMNGTLAGLAGFLVGHVLGQIVDVAHHIH